MRLRNILAGMVLLGASAFATITLKSYYSPPITQMRTVSYDEGVQVNKTYELSVPMRRFFWEDPERKIRERYKCQRVTITREDPRTRQILLRFELYLCDPK